ATDTIEIQPNHLVLDHAQLTGDPLCRLQLGTMPLAIIETHGVTAVALSFRHRHNRGGVESARQQNHCFLIVHSFTLKHVEQVLAALLNLVSDQARHSRGSCATATANAPASCR